jgi:hypothetical protein
MKADFLFNIVIKISGRVLRLRISKTGSDLSNLKAAVLEMFVGYV